MTSLSHPRQCYDSHGPPTHTLGSYIGPDLTRGRGVGGWLMEKAEVEPYSTSVSKAKTRIG